MSPEDPYLSRELKDYFPDALSDRFSELMKEHRLWREIICDQGDQFDRQSHAARISPCA